MPALPARPVALIVATDAGVGLQQGKIASEEDGLICSPELCDWQPKR